MDYIKRMELVRLYGPRRPILRAILLCLALYDNQDDHLVYGGRLQEETGYCERAIRYALRELVAMGWLKPEKAPNPADHRQVSRNQYTGGIYQSAAAERVHGHLGGCRPGGEGAKTRYYITYRTERAAERPRGRNVAKGERGAPLKGARGAAADQTEAPTRGHPVPTRGHPVPNKGAPRAPDSRSEIEIDCDAGGGPPGPPKDGVTGSPYGEPPSLSRQGPQDRLPGADAPEGPQGHQDMPTRGRQLRNRWREVLDLVSQATGDDPGVKLWLRTAKVHPIEITADIVHVRVPTVLAAEKCGRYAAQLCAAVSALVHPVTTAVYHPAQESAA
jgi:hypothetical protein